MTAALEICEIAWPADVTSAVRAWSRGRELAWLDSSSTAETAAGAPAVSILAIDPTAVIEQFDGRPAELRVGNLIVDSDASGWKLLRSAIHRIATPASAAVAALPAPAGANHAPLESPGWIGYAGYEMARQLERLPSRQRDDFGLPWLRFALFDRIIILQHAVQRAWAVASPAIRPAFGAPPRRQSDDFENWCADWDTAARQRPGSAGPMLGQRPPRITCESSAADHHQRIARAIEYIAAGDIYQVNLAHRLRFTGIGDSFDTYCALRVRNPAPYAAFLHWNDGAIASVSPELFLRLRGRKILTSPIKGTRPRTGDAPLDSVYQAQLLASEKDAAELNMIVDLHRNDLGRVCNPGSVRVAAARRVESHPTVMHTVADIVGTLALQRTAIDLLTACFPAGSVTGVPKIRAMQIIDELETAPRGAYTGAIGMFGSAGEMTMSVAIRTLQIKENRAVLHVGGGIVADSDPADEYEETIAKGRGIVEALTGVGTAVCSQPVR